MSDAAFINNEKAERTFWWLLLDDGVSRCLEINIYGDLSISFTRRDTSYKLMIQRYTDAGFLIVEGDAGVLFNSLKEAVLRNTNV